MAAKVRYVPEGYHTATPYLIVNDGAAAIDFYKRAFGARELVRMPDATGKKVGHAEIKIGDSPIMLADESPEMNSRSPQTLGGSPITILLYVEDVDTFVKEAVRAGGKLERPIEDQFYGDRSGSLKDPFGHTWHISTHKEDVTPEEMKRRMASMAKK